MDFVTCRTNHRNSPPISTCMILKRTVANFDITLNEVEFVTGLSGESS